MAIYLWNIQDSSCVCGWLWFYLNCVHLLVNVDDYSHNARNKHYSIYYFLQKFNMRRVLIPKAKDS